MLLNQRMVDLIQAQKYLLHFDGHAISLSFEKLNVEEAAAIALALNANAHVTQVDIELNDWQPEILISFLKNLRAPRFISVCWRAVWQNGREIDSETIESVINFIDRQPNLRAFNFQGISVPLAEARAIDFKIQNRLNPSPAFNSLSSVWKYPGNFHTMNCLSEEAMADEDATPVKNTTYAVY